MIELFPAERLQIQKDLEWCYKASIQYYKQWAESNSEDPSSPIAARQVSIEAEKVAKAEALMSRSGEVPTDKLTLGERVAIEGHLRESKDCFIRLFRDKEPTAGVKIAETEALLKSFNAVTQRKRAEAIPNSAYKMPPIPPMGGCR